EAPKRMWMPLVVLAILATIGGFIGISTAFTRGKEVGGRMNIVTWMNPIIWNPATRSFGTEPGGSIGETRLEAPPPNLEQANKAALPYGPAGFNLARAAESKLGSETAAEWLFILISLTVA